MTLCFAAVELGSWDTSRKQPTSNTAPQSASLSRHKMEEHSDGGKRPKRSRDKTKTKGVRDNVSADPKGPGPKALQALQAFPILLMLTLLSVTDASTLGPTTPIGNGSAAAHRDVVAASQLIVASLSTPPAATESEVSSASRPEIASSSEVEKLSQGKREMEEQSSLVCLSNKTSHLALWLLIPCCHHLLLVVESNFSIPLEIGSRSLIGFFSSTDGHKFG